MFEPQATWLGSFNFSKMAGGNAESALIVASAGAARFFTAEWALWLGVAEPLAWTSAAPKPGALLRTLDPAG